MADPLSTAEGSNERAARNNFIGTVEFSRPNCDCEICESGREAAEKKGESYETDYDHFAAIEPLTEYDEQMSVLGLNTNTNYSSKWMVMLHFVEKIHGNLRSNDVNSLEDLGDFLTGRTYEWMDITWEEEDEIDFEDSEYTPRIKDIFADSDNKPNAMLVPVREITDEEELQEAGAEPDTSEVEDVEL